MSLTVRTIFLSAILLLAHAGGEAQLFSDQGTMSGTGLTFLPTTATAPEAEMSAQFSRVTFVSRNERALNVWGLRGGFSTHVEGYMRLTAEQLGTFSSLTSFSFGGKFRSPIPLPIAGRTALWMETTNSNQPQAGSTIPPEAFRTALTASFGSNGTEPVVAAGLATVNNATGLLAGGGVTLAAGHAVQIGGELLYGYSGRGSVHILANAALRLFSNVSLLVNPGYLSVPALSSWFISAGLSFTTAGIDFHPVREEKKDEFRLPSIEEIEKQSQEEKK